MKILKGGMENVRGFKFSAVKCGIRYPDKLDIALIYSPAPCNASGTFTKNRVYAAPVKLCKSRINNKIHGILINSTNANACTGEQGYQNALLLTEAIAKSVKSKPGAILMASTGIIGVQLPFNKMKNAVPQIIEELSEKNAGLVAKAIMTTDTFSKEHAVSFKSSMGDFRIAGTAKGSGMISPNMATLLAFIITDAPVDKKDLDKIFKRIVDKTFNSITIDGDTSTNDSAIILSPDSPPLKNKTDLENFEESLFSVCHELSKMLLKDGEGTTKVVKINVTGAKNIKDAEIAARAISESLLVKTAIFGNDPNWGRIACAAGYSGAMVDSESISVKFGAMTLLKKGTPVKYNKEKLLKILAGAEYTISIDLGKGKASHSILTTDISYDYVKINAEYST